MRVTVTILGILGVAAVAARHSPVRAQQATSRSVLDGVYTEKQARRGEALYREHCASCHGAGLMGEDMTPPLTGSQFMSNWSETTVGDLADRVRVTMPADHPGTLSRQQSTDIVAYVLNVNKFPVGKTELARELDLQNQIKIEAPKLLK